MLLSQQSDAGACVHYSTGTISSQSWVKLTANGDKDMPVWRNVSARFLPRGAVHRHMLMLLLLLLLAAVIVAYPAPQTVPTKHTVH
jgi:hypothetical protein